MHQKAETLLCRHGCLRVAGNPRWHRNGRGFVATRGCRGERRRCEVVADRGLIICEALEHVPFTPLADTHGLAQRLDLRRRHQSGVIVFVAGERQTEALDRIGDETGRAIMTARFLERIDDGRQIVTAEVCHQGGKVVVAALLDQAGDRSLVTEVVQKPPAPRSAALEGQG